MHHNRLKPLFKKPNWVQASGVLPSWQRAWTWYAPPRHWLLQGCGPPRAAMHSFDARLDHPKLSFFLDHKARGRSESAKQTRVGHGVPLVAPDTHASRNAQVVGRALLPGAGMLEAALAACTSLADEGGSPALALTHVTIPAALQLSEVRAVPGSPSTSLRMECTHSQACRLRRPRCHASPLLCPGHGATLQAGQARLC